KRKSYPAFIKLDAINYAKQMKEKLKKAKQTNRRIGSGIGVTPSDVKSNMKCLLNTEFRQIYPNAIYKFQAADTWFYHFINHSDFSLHRRTKVSQKLPKDLQEKLLMLHEDIYKLRRNNNFNLNCIANVDETPIFFDIVGALTLDYHGTHSNNISPKIIFKSFKKCRISNALDGSENGLIGINEENNDEHFVVLNNENKNESIEIVSLI
ncbi:10447_t:CDS:2, partial [Cetraspora pellucida]